MYIKFYIFNKYNIQYFILFKKIEFTMMYTQIFILYKNFNNNDII